MTLMVTASALLHVMLHGFTLLCLLLIVIWLLIGRR